MTSVVDLDELLRKGWPAAVEVPLDGWIARISGGVTKRANAVLPLTAPVDLPAAIDRVERLYAEHRLAPTFQIGPNTQPAELDVVLAERGYRRRNPTSIQTAAVDEVLSNLVDVSVADVRVSPSPGQEWLDLWWSVDGRGDAAALRTAKGILTGGPSVYASRHDSSGVTAIGRLALVGDWAGLYCLAVRPDRRRLGHASMIIKALLVVVREHRVRHSWLQVLADNAGARALYARLGFATVADYHYRTLATAR